MFCAISDFGFIILKMSGLHPNHLHAGGAEPGAFSDTLLFQIPGAEAVVSVAQYTPHKQSLSPRSEDSLDKAACGEELGMGLDGVGACRQH